MARRTSSGSITWRPGNENAPVGGRRHAVLRWAPARRHRRVLRSSCSCPYGPHGTRFTVDAPRYQASAERPGTGAGDARPLEADRCRLRIRPGDGPQPDGAARPLTSSAMRPARR